jgi:hypothetical protein
VWAAVHACAWAAVHARARGPRTRAGERCLQLSICRPEDSQERSRSVVMLTKTSSEWHRTSVMQVPLHKRKRRHVLGSPGMVRRKVRNARQPEAFCCCGLSMASSSSRSTREPEVGIHAQ